MVSMEIVGCTMKQTEMTSHEIPQPISIELSGFKQIAIFVISIECNVISQALSVGKS